MIPTSRRLQYARGYLALGLLPQAATELAAVAPEEQSTPAVMAAHLDLHLAENNWEAVADFARRLVALDRADVGAWIALGCAVRRTVSIAAARDLLLTIEPLHGATHAIIHYNLACYHCLLGDRREAARCFAKACHLDAAYKSVALSDPDLQPLWPQLAAMK